MAGYDVVVVGGGSAGCVLAARLSEDPDRSVCLIEGGPDYGPYAEVDAGGHQAVVTSGTGLPAGSSAGPAGAGAAAS
jgi:choline dehydrogenase-like flavoprotein